MRTEDALPKLLEVFRSLNIDSSRAHGSRLVRHINLGGTTFSLFTGGARDPEIVVGSIEQGYRGITEGDLANLGLKVRQHIVETVKSKITSLGISPICTDAILSPRSCRQLSGPIIQRSVQLTENTRINLATPWAPYSSRSADDITELWISQSGQLDRPVTAQDLLKLRLVNKKQ